MPPKIQKCSICGALETSKWFTLDRRTLCADCHDLQLHPPLEPVRERTPDSPERVAPALAIATDEQPQHAAPMEVDTEQAQRKAEPVTTRESSGPTAPRAESLTIEELQQQNGEKGCGGGGGGGIAVGSSGLASPGLQSPRRLRRRTCPTKTPIRRRVTKAGRGNPNAKQKSRRTLLKKPTTKTPGHEMASTKAVEKLFYEDTWYQIGDIVSLLDTKDNTYYAQIRGLLVDAYNEKSAVLTWLIPTTASPPPNEGFDPATYQIGPDEDCPRQLTYVRFIMHAPSNYYLDRNDPFPRPETYGPANTTQRHNRNYVWASIAHLHYGDEK